MAVAVCVLVAAVVAAVPVALARRPVVVDRWRRDGRSGGRRRLGLLREKLLGLRGLGRWPARLRRLGRPVGSLRRRGRPPAGGSRSRRGRWLGRCGRSGLHHHRPGCAVADQVRDGRRCGWAAGGLQARIAYGWARARSSGEDDPPPGPEPGRLAGRETLRRRRPARTRPRSVPPRRRPLPSRP